MRKILRMAIFAMIAFFALTPSAKAAVMDTAQVTEVVAVSADLEYEEYSHKFLLTLTAADGSGIFLRFAGTPFLGFPDNGTYTDDARGSFLFLPNGDEKSVVSFNVTVTNTTPIGACNYDVTCVVSIPDPTTNAPAFYDYHFTYTAQQEVTNQVVLNIPYSNVQVSDYTREGTAWLTGSFDGGQVMLALSSIAADFQTANFYGDGEWRWMPIFNNVVLISGTDSTAVFPYHMDIIEVSDALVHVVMDCWNGTEYDVTCYLKPIAAQALLYNGSQAIELVEGENAWNDVNHMDSLVITFEGFKLTDNTKLYIWQPGDITDEVELISRGNNSYAAAYSLDFARNTGEYIRYVLTIYDSATETLFLYRIVNNEPIAAQALLYNGSQAIELVEGENAENDVNHMDSLVITFSGFSPADKLELHIAKPNDSGIDVVDLIPRGNNRYVAAYSLDFIRNTGEWTRYLLTIYDPVAEAFFLYKIVNNEPAPEPAAQATLYNGSEAIELAEYTKPELLVNNATHMDSLVVMFTGFESIQDVMFSFYDHKFWGSQDGYMSLRGNNTYAMPFSTDFFTSAPADLRYEIRLYVHANSGVTRRSFMYFIYNDGTAIQLVEQNSAAVKTLRDGRLVISVGDAEYTVDGMQLK